MTKLDLKPYLPYLCTFILWAGINLFASRANGLRNENIYLKNPQVYKTQEEFSSDLEIEKKKLGLENIAIEVKDNENEDGGHTWRTGKDEFLISFNPKYKTRKTLRHELHHVAHWNDNSFLDAFFLGNVEEWQATSYSINE